MDTTNATATILAIDDMPLNLKTLAMMLEKEGFKVLTATSGAAGMVLAQQQHPDLILLDLIMPDEDGFAVLEKLKATPVLAHIPVIFLTAEADVAAKVKGFELGAVDYIMKPFKSEEVKARIRLHMRLAQATKALLEQQAEKLKTLKDAQDSMLIKPADMPEAGFDVFYRPLNEVGGDIYEVIKLSDDIFGFFIGDVAGHDLGSSLVTVYVKALLKTNCTIYTDPAESMMMINAVLTGVLKTEQYLTANYLLLNRALGMVSFVNMAHPAFVHAPAGEPSVLIKSQGSLLGILPDAYYRTVKLPVKKGDLLVLYTDGIVEYGGEKRELTRATAAVDSLADKTVMHPAEAIFNAACPDKSKICDDILVLTITV